MAPNTRVTPPDVADLDGVGPETLDEDYLAADSVAFDGDDLSGRVGTAELRRVTMSSVNLSGGQLRSLSLSNVSFTDVDLSNATFNAVSANRVSWRGCRAIGLGMAFTTATDVLIADCVLNYARIEIIRAKARIVFTGCAFREAMIIGDLTGVEFDDCEFTETEFRAVKAVNCDLRTSRFTAPRGLSTLRGARVTVNQTLEIADALAAEVGLIID